jgi:chitinase
MKTYGFEGLDLDFEFPDAADKTNFATWVRELRNKFGSSYELTAAISAVESKIREGLDVVSISRDLDAIHVMAYDFHGSWESTADHHSPLKKRSWDTTTFYAEHA